MCVACKRWEDQQLDEALGRMDSSRNLNDIVIKIGEVLLAFDSIFSEHHHIIWSQIFASAFGFSATFDFSFGYFPATFDQRTHTIKGTLSTFHTPHISKHTYSPISHL